MTSAGFTVSASANILSVVTTHWRPPGALLELRTTRGPSDLAKASPRAACAPDGATLPIERPRTRAECIDGPRPCPWIGCRAHLLTDRVTKDGTLRASPAPGRPSKPIDAWTDEELGASLARLPESCALDVAERGGVSLAEIARLLGGMSRERARQLEASAFEKLSAAPVRTWGSHDARWCE
jgi:hypothetical protein